MSRCWDMLRHWSLFDRPEKQMLKLNEEGSHCFRSAWYRRQYAEVVRAKAKGHWFSIATSGFSKTRSRRSGSMSSGDKPVGCMNFQLQKVARNLQVNLLHLLTFQPDRESRGTISQLLSGNVANRSAMISELLPWTPCKGCKQLLRDNIDSGFFSACWHDFAIFTFRAWLKILPQFKPMGQVLAWNQIQGESEGHRLAATIRGKASPASLRYIFFPSHKLQSDAGASAVSRWSL